MINVALFGTGRLSELVVSLIDSLPDVTLCVNETLCDIKLNPSFVILVEDNWDASLRNTVLQECRRRQLNVFPIIGRMNTVYFGSMEIPNRPGCMDCFTVRWEHAFRRVPLMSSLKAFSTSSHIINMPLSLSENGMRLLVDTLRVELSSLLKGQEAKSADQIGIISSVSVTVSWRTLLPSHTCPRCSPIPNDEQKYAVVDFQSHSLKSQNRLRVRSVQLSHLSAIFVDPDVGYISSLQPTRPLDPYVGMSARIQLSPSEYVMGYGVSYNQDEASVIAILEALERVSGRSPTRSLPVAKGSYRNFKDCALNPRKLGMYDDTCYKSDHAMLKEFSVDADYSWLWAFSCRRKKPILIPEQVAYYRHVPAGEQRFVDETSNGCAVGGTMEEAILYGIFEVIERDSLLNTWYAKMPLPEILVDKHNPALNLLIEGLLQKGYDLRLFNMAHDLKIPSILAVAVTKGTGAPAVVCGTSCHLLPHVAVEGAVRELSIQLARLTSLLPEQWNLAEEKFGSPSKITKPSDHPLINSLPMAYSRWSFLLDQGRFEKPLVERVFSTIDDDFSLHSNDILTILEGVLEHLFEHGFDILVVNQTNVELTYASLFAVKVIIPGMTPITFGHGRQRTRGLNRVLELPHRMGYAERALTWEELNPHPHPLA